MSFTRMNQDVVRCHEVFDVDNGSRIRGHLMRYLSREIATRCIGLGDELLTWRRVSIQIFMISIVSSRMISSPLKFLLIRWRISAGSILQPHSSLGIFYIKPSSNKPRIPCVRYTVRSLQVIRRSGINALFVHMNPTEPMASKRSVQFRP